ncbi:MAG: DUF1552 domain-containing protein [Verrucomicrobia bacterium]|nr:DUF1552 domain-containing protein [Verrucomicrobiota bacterium]NBU10149.1 DUF1552 domain-containing protein [Pseudomonadota bacterium]NDA66996.1 DUF1552 domain-containing protein [Verrucomicrobiota bacterium]NDB74530.1 DUF1552 domain-containing protein [Verrucomicrobiota bacterium]NDD38715.1 DUF1552 domain-containing protein [Verrucomicrobiota bacterium]
MSHLNLRRWEISRRTALRGIGATIALPLLNAMADLPAAAKPKRSVFLYIPNGVNTLTWQIHKAGADYEFTAPLKSLEKHRADITPISGLHHPMVIGKHHNCEKVWLTGANVPGDGGAFRNTVSADQLVADVQGVSTRFSSLEMAIEGTSLSWSKDGIQLPAERNTQQLFNQLFGVEKDSKETIRRRLSRRGSILDLVAEDAKRVNRGLGTEDRSKLDEYLTAVRQVEERTKRADEWLNIPKPQVPADAATRLTRKLSMAEAGEYYRLFYDLMAMALRTDSTRVITCGIGSEGNTSGIPEIGILQTRHGLSHHNGDPEQLRRLTATDTFLVDQLSYFLDQLKATQEDGRPLLDTTQVLWGSGMAYGHSHGNANLPTILCGGKALGYKHGTHVDFNLPKIGKYDVADANSHYKICSRPVDDTARLSNLLLTMVQRAGVKAEKFQDSTGPLSQIVA